jgi:hypothetical protein
MGFLLFQQSASTRRGVHKRLRITSTEVVWFASKTWLRNSAGRIVFNWKAYLMS